MTVHFGFDNSYARLPDRFFARLPPTPVSAPKLIKLNRQLASDFGLDAEWLASPEGVQVLAGNRLPEGAEPTAMAYAGHQFGNFVPQLGDGRAILLGEVVGKDGLRRDIQLKGSGPTPFSREEMAEPRLGPVLREYGVSEAMAALDIPTARALAAVLTGEPVIREMLLPGAVLTRVAASHIRIGTFQFFAARGDVDGVRTLADHVLAQHYPEALDSYHPATVFSSIDHHGRYAFANQPRIALWNLARLAETLLPLLSDDQDKAVQQAQAALGGFGPTRQTE